MIEPHLILVRGWQPHCGGLKRSDDLRHKPSIGIQSFDEKWSETWDVVSVTRSNLDDDESKSVVECK
jgi:hypothetical protein